MVVMCQMIHARLTGMQGPLDVWYYVLRGGVFYLMIFTIPLHMV
jgi:hypothetical protein